MIKKTIIMLAFWGLLISSGCSENPPAQSQIPPFEVNDICGQTITNTQFIDGYTLFYFPTGHETHSEFFSWVEDYEREYDVSVKKLAVFKEEETANNGWVVVVDKILNAKLRKLANNRSVAFFHNGQLKFVTSVTGERSRPHFLLSYHAALNGYENPQDYIEESRPEDFINVKEIYHLCACDSLDKRKLTVLIVSDVFARCEEKFLIKYFNDKLEGDSQLAGFILFDDCMSAGEIEILRHNSKFNIPTASLSEDLVSELKDLGTKHFGAVFNILFFFNENGEPVESLYVYDRCPGIAKYL